MKRAILSTCPDARQSSFLERVYGSWERFAARHGLDIVVIRRPVIPEHAYWDRWLSWEQPELAGYDQVLWLDNDVWITPHARNPFEFWDGEKVLGNAECKQLGWDRERIQAYYPGFMIDLGPGEEDFKVFNTGTALFARHHGPIFRRIYDLWESQWFPRLSASEDPHFQSKFVREADGPFISWQLQKAGMIAEWPEEFNRIFWVWYVNHKKLPMKYMQMECKAGQVLRGKLPEPLWRAAFAHAREVLRESARDCSFLHIAASKSPLWLVE
jgi:hypothetical protein